MISIGEKEGIVEALLDIDEDTHAAAAAILGTATATATVNAALAAVVQDRRRGDALAREFERVHLNQAAMDEEVIRWE